MNQTFSLFGNKVMMWSLNAAILLLNSPFYSCLSVKDLQEELEKQESSLRRFGAVTHQLLRDCHPSVSDSLNNTLKDVNAR